MKISDEDEFIFTPANSFSLYVYTAVSNYQIQNINAQKYTLRKAARVNGYPIHEIWIKIEILSFVSIMKKKISLWFV